MDLIDLANLAITLAMNYDVIIMLITCGIIIFVAIKIGAIIYPIIKLVNKIIPKG